MKVGFIGLGKLGLPVALAVESRGHSVVGYDIEESIKSILETKKYPFREEWAQSYLDRTNMEFQSVEEVVRFSEIIFVPIQTPHHEKYEGITRLPEERVDFDYTWLKEGIKTLSDEIERQGEDKIVVIISTVLPGTTAKEIAPLLGKHSKLCYNPFFIAMGTTIRDFLHPEFVLLGSNDTDETVQKVKDFYRSLHHAPVYHTTIENAELIKVVYNTFISTKLAFVNTVMEMCSKLPNTNVDDVTNALKLANERIISDKYFSGGMGDGGGCHPRDNIALSWLARKLDLSNDWFEHIMLQREKQTDWLADLILENRGNRAVVILGKSFKPETNITTGSPSILLKNVLNERDLDPIMWDPYIDSSFDEHIKSFDNVTEERLYFVGTKHPEFMNFPFKKGDIVIDPWRYINDIDGVTIIRIGDNK